MTFVLILIICALFFSCSVTVVAQTDSHALEGVEVVSRHTFSDIIPTQTLSGEQLERLNALSVADALRYFSGLQIKDYGGIGGIKTVNIRSMGSQHLGVYYDGIELGNAQNGQIDLGQFSLDNVEAVSLYNGQKSSLMQTASDYGNAGNVYIRTRVPFFLADEKRHLRVNVKYGSCSMMQFSALYERKLSSQTSLSVTIGTLTSDGRYKFRYMRRNIDGTVAYDTTAVRQNGDVQSLRLECNLNGQMSRGAWNVKAYTYQSARGIPGAIVNNVWRREERQTDGNTFFQGAWQYDVNEWYTLRVMGKYATYRTHYVNRDTTTMMVDNRYRQQEAYVSTTHCVKICRWLSASMAYDARWSNLTSDVYTCPEPHRWSHLVSMAVAASAKRFGVQASLLYNNTHDTRRMSATGVSPVGSLMSVSRFTPALFLNYYLLADRSLSVRAYMKNSFRMPTFNELYYAEIGNANLRPERAAQYNLGVRYDAPSNDVSAVCLRASADVYYNKVHNKIIAYPKGQQFRWTMLNLGKVGITGVDAEVDVSCKVRSVASAPLICGLRLQYTYQRAVDVTSQRDAYYEHQIPYIPRHSGSAVFGADWRGLSFNYSFIYTGERYSQQENIAYNHLEPWYTSDLSVSYTLAKGKKRIKGALEVSNLFAQDYDVIQGYPMPGRMYAVSLSLAM